MRPDATDCASPRAGKPGAIARMGALLAGLLVLISLGSPARATTTFAYTGSLQTWTAPASGLYDITAWGAQGGSDGLALPGYGAEIGGAVTLSQGEVLDIVVGGQGIALGNGGSGGGGSFVYTAGPTPLVVAGGGGGSYVTGRFPGQDGQTAPGNGQGGPGGCGGSGAGFYSSGSVECPGDSGGASFPSWAGGTGEYGNAGGYGGGGGGYGSGGGGGGYSGGAGGTGTNEAGGGGSFLADTALELVELSGVQHGDGEVTIGLAGANADPVPEPATGAILAAACVLLARFRRGGRPAEC